MSSALNYRYPAIQGDDDMGSEFEDEFEEEYEEEVEAELGRAEGEEEYEFEDEFEGEQFGGGLSRALGGFLAGGSEGEEETEAEFDFEEEGEAFVNPVRRIYRDAELMAHLSTRAAQTESEAEAEAFVAALVPIAGRLIPRAGRLITRSAPTLIRGVSRITRQLRRNPATRQFVTAIPVILQRTAQSLADQAARGRPITADTVIRTLTAVASRILGRPAPRRRAVRAVRVFDRGYHNRWRTAPGGRRPAARPRRRGASPMTVRHGRRRR